MDELLTNNKKAESFRIGFGFFNSCYELVQAIVWNYFIRIALRICVNPFACTLIKYTPELKLAAFQFTS